MSEGEAENAAELIDRACSTNPASCQEFLSTLSSEAERTRLAFLSSAVWHEKRHFLDLILTNYGVFRVRQFFQIYVELQALLFEARQAGTPVFCPLDAYADASRSKAHSLPSRPVAETVGRALRAAKRTLKQDQFLTSLLPDLKVSVGGDAQLEALAFASQQIAAQEHLGIEHSLIVQREMMRMPGYRSRYAWATQLGMNLGLINHKPADLPNRPDLITWDFIFPIVFASLMMRSYGQDQSNSGSVLPSNRLSLFCAEASKEGKDLSKLQPLESWKWVNETSKRLWGRSIIKELQSDLEYEEQWITKVKKTENMLPELTTVLEEFHRLRRQLSMLLIQTPESMIDPMYSSTETLRQLHPYLIVTKANGILGKVPDTLDRVFGFKDPRLDGRQLEKGTAEVLSKIGEWYWTATRANPDAAKFAFRKYDAWRCLFIEFAPLSKLLLNGRVHKTVPGPELTFAQSYLLSQTGVQLAIEPAYAYPRYDPVGSAKFIRLLRHDQIGVCDRCKATLPPECFYVIPPWFFRANLKTLDLAIEAYGGGGSGELFVWRDWSDWLVCEQCFRYFVDHEDGRLAWNLVSTVSFDAVMRTHNATTSVAGCHSSASAS